MEFKIESGKTKEDIKKFVDERLDKLYNEAPKRDLVGFEKQSPLHGIIREDTLIDNGSAYYYIKDRNYLYDFVYSMYQKKITDINSILVKIYYYIRYYFGFNGNDDLRNEILNNNIEKGYNDISILYKKNAGMCSERAAMAQNLFSFFDIESWYMIGEVLSEKEHDPHAFNIINYNNNYYVYDSSRDVPVYSNNKIIDYRYYTCPIEFSVDTSKYILNDYYYIKQEDDFEKNIIGKVIYSVNQCINELDIKKM